MSKTIFDVLVEGFDKEIEIARNALSRGVCSSYEQYKETCGLIRGLEHARQSVTDLSRNFEDSDDD